MATARSEYFLSKKTNHEKMRCWDEKVKIIGVSSKSRSLDNQHSIFSY